MGRHIRLWSRLKPGQAALAAKQVRLPLIQELIRAVSANAHATDGIGA